MKTKIILEFGCNHQGQIPIALEMIDQAEKLGVWGVKLQKRTLSNIPEEEAKQPRSLDNSFGETFFEHRKALEFSLEDLAFLKRYTERKGLAFICTAFDLEAYFGLVDVVGCEYIKLPSQLYLDEKIHAAYKNNVPRPKVIVSTGMHTDIEIFNNSPWFRDAWLIMACTSVYPFSDPELFNIGIIQDLMRFRGTGLIGYSSHDTGEAIHPAIIAGAQFVERHFTLNKYMKGSDHSTVSSDYTEIKALMDFIEKRIEPMLGHKEILSDEETAVALRYRKNG